MLLERSGYNDSSVLMSVLASKEQQPVQISGDFGIAWALVFQIAGWVIQGIGLGLSIKDAVSQANQKLPAGQTVATEDIDLIADQLAKQFPTTSKAQWTQLLTEGFATKMAIPGPVGPVTPAPCPEGYYRDPATGICVEAKTGLGKLPTWAWIVIGVLGFLWAQRSGLLAPRA